MNLKRQCLTFSALLFLFAAPAFAGRLPIHLPNVTTLSPADVLPSAFQGIWDYTQVLKDCETMIVLSTISGTDTICANEELTPPDTSQSVACTFEISETGYHVVCSGTLALEDTCSVDYDYDITTTLSGNTLTTVGIYMTTYNHCGPIPPQCIRYEYTALRVGNANEECAVPVENTTWGWIKSKTRYR